MIIRIVQMEFRPEAVEQIRSRLVEQAPKVRAFPGCLALALHPDAENPNIFYSVSHWVDKEALEVYRRSALFREFWAELKVHFVQPARAFTLEPSFLAL